MLHWLHQIADHTKSIPLGVKLVVLVIFLRSFGWGFVDPYFPLFVKGFVSSYTGIGSLISIISLACLVTMVPLTRLADKVKDTTLIADGELFYLLAIFLYILAGLTHSLFLLIVALTLNGVGYPLIYVGVETYIRKQHRKINSGSYFGFYTALNYLGWILGMLIGAFGIQYYSFNWMFVFILPSVFLGWVILRRIRERGLHSIFSGFSRYFHRIQDLKDILTDLKSLRPRAGFFLFLAFFDGFMVMFTLVFIPLFASGLGLSLKETSLLMAVTYLPLAFSYLFSEWMSRLRRTSLITLGLFIGAVSFALLSLTLDQIWIALLCASTSLSVAILRPAYNEVLTSLSPPRMMGEVTSIVNIFMRLGYVVGPILSGYFADYFGLTSAFLGTALFALILATVSLLFRGLNLATATQAIGLSTLQKK